MKQTLLTIWPFGLVLGLVLVGLEAVEYSYVAFDLTQEVYLGAVAVMFMVIGIVAGARWLHRPGVRTHTLPSKSADRPAPAGSTSLLHRPSSVAAESHEGHPLLSGTSDLTERELEVLRELTGGYTNQQIAERLFISLNTTKTHVSRVYAKLGVERRTQAVEKARELGLLS